MSRQAVIDVGSNSSRLLVADCIDGQIAAVHKELSTTRLSEGLTQTGNLSDAAMGRSVEVINDFYVKAKELDAKQIWCFATAAVRNSENSEVFVSLVKESTELDVDILSKEQEAHIGFIGVGGQGMRGILDIGGGSTEIAVGDGETIYRCSMNLGAVAALEMYPLGNIADELTLEAMQQWTMNIMSKEAADVLEKSNDVSFVGIGGTMTSLVAMEHKMAKYDPLRVQGKRLSIRTIEKWYNDLLKMPLATRRTLIGLNPERADIIIGGIVILLTFMNLFSLREIRVSDRGNMEGYIMMKLKSFQEIN
jgi:exopolyphosphatase/guanosine-5'-triphosphate,3'-diphosphate pyrophosphatase